VKNALIKDGWTITHDPLILPFGGRNIYVDIGAEAPIGAAKDGRQIAVEIKSFIGVSEVTDKSYAVAVITSPLPQPLPQGEGSSPSRLSSKKSLILGEKADNCRPRHSPPLAGGAGGGGKAVEATA
jgi:hypothetical protein